MYVRKQLDTCKRLHFDGDANSTDASLNSTEPGEQVTRTTRVSPFKLSRPKKV